MSLDSSIFGWTGTWNHIHTPNERSWTWDSNLRVVDSDLEFHQQVLFRVHFLDTIHQYVKGTRLTVDQTSNHSDSDPDRDLYSSHITFLDMLLGVTNKHATHLQAAIAQYI